MYKYNFDTDAVIAELGFADEPTEVKNQLIGQVYERLYERINARLQLAMTGTQLEEYDDAMLNKSDAETEAWLEENFPAYKQWFDEELTSLVAEAKHMGEVYENAAKSMSQER